MTKLVQDGRDMMGAGLEAWLTGRCDPPRRDMLPRLAATLGTRVPPVALVALDVEPVPAVVDYGRWCAMCPCGNAEMVWLEGPYQIWCGRCGNADLAGQHRPVVLPDRAHEIGQALSARLRAQDRCWRPEQAVESLWAWNDEHPTLVIAAAGGD